jgi:hypothetical protein
MPKSHTEINDDELLDYEGAETAKIARFERIMQQRALAAMDALTGRIDDVIREMVEVTGHLAKVGSGLVGVTETIHRVGQLVDSKAAEAIVEWKAAGIAQTKQQTAMKWLTLALVGCTAVYTGLNCWVAYEMHQGNIIQTQAAAAASDQAAAAHDQAAAAREANELQRRALVAADRAASDAAKGRADAKARGVKEKEK